MDTLTRWKLLVGSFLIAWAREIAGAFENLGARKSARLYRAQIDAHEAAFAQGTNLTGLFIGLMVAGIVAISVFIPVITNAINNANVSGNTKTILDLLPLFAALLLLIALAAPLMRRV